MPDIIDDDSTEAYIESVSIPGFAGDIPCKKLISVVSNRNKIGNKIIIQQMDGMSISSCEVGILLVDVMRVPRRSGYTFEIKFTDSLSQYGGEEDGFLAGSEGIFVGINPKLKMEFERVDQNAVATFRFLIPMSYEVNPLFFDPIEKGVRRL